ncbi:MAG: glycine/sarcosine/betaine reductase selenoprotein B family protein, partial [Methyloligellaceae bacterium]
SECRIALVTTAAPFQPDKGDQGPGAPYNSAAKFYKVYSESTDGEPDVRISHVGIDRKHTSAEDVNTWFPLKQLKRAAAEGRIGGVAPRFHGAPTNRSHHTTIEQDCPEILRRLREDAVDAVILVANCPVCHQTIALTARHLEQNGIPTIVRGCAKDIVEHAGVARFLFSDFPLGNAAGRPHDEASQASTLDLALDVLEAARGPRTTVQSPLRWSDDPDWKLDFCNVERIPAEEIARLRQSFDEQKEIAKGRRVEAGLKVKAAE